MYATILLIDNHFHLGGVAVFYQIKRFVVQEGTSQLVLDRHSKEGLIEKQPGFVSVKVLQKKVRRGDEEIMLIVEWESEQDWKNWEKSPEHIAGHKANAGKPKPEHIIEVSQNVYELKIQK